MYFLETLRKYPPGPFLNRICTKEYKIPGTKIIIEKGTTVQIPVYGLHHDEKFYPNPKQFNPNRFHSESSKEKSFADMPFLPFGVGPRNCIAMRMGRMESKIGLAMLLQEHNYNLGDDLIDRDLEISPGTFVLAPKGLIQLKISTRNKNDV